MCLRSSEIIFLKIRRTIWSALFIFVAVKNVSLPVRIFYRVKNVWLSVLISHAGPGIALLYTIHSRELLCLFSFNAAFLLRLL
jgi:hypothetical protein